MNESPPAQRVRTPRPARPAPAARVPRRALHGVLLLDKPLGLSSNDALQKARRLFRAEKGGHTGTLDPLASGLLPLCFGAATKFAQASLEADKRYRATLQLGETRRGGDLEGEVLERCPVNVSRDELRAVCDRFTGEIDQLPPMESALKHKGKALYEYARAGVELEIERAPRKVLIHRIDIVDAADVDAGGEAVPNRWTLDVHCSKGTYIRSLAEAIGEALGCGAHLAGLRRTASGALTLEGAVTLEQLEAMSEAQRDALLLGADVTLASSPIVRLGVEDAARFLTGLRRRVKLADAPSVRVYGPEPQAFLGSAHIVAGELIPTRLLSPVEVQGLLSQVQAHAHPPDASAPEPAVASVVA